MAAKLRIHETAIFVLNDMLSSRTMKIGRRPNVQSATAFTIEAVYMVPRTTVGL